MNNLSLKEIQAGEFDILAKFKEICEAHSFLYFLTYGTLLGAVRHHGFIPWDDDIDVFMPRDDYQAFITLYKKQQSAFGGLVLFHYSIQKNYPYPIARLSDTRFSINYENVKDYGLGLFLDIYPLDGAQYGFSKKRLSNENRLAEMAGFNKFIPSKSKIKNILKFPVYLFSKAINLNRLLAKIDKLSQKNPYSRSEFVGCPWDDLNAYPREWFCGNRSESFEGVLFSVPSNFDAFLRMVYGDYMKLPPVEDRVGHHFYTAVPRAGNEKLSK
jgi:lipopolysaccharide cholinephosphotransferase